MHTIDPYIVKITCNGEIGSGFILYTHKKSDSIYIITARHIFVDGNGTLRRSIKIDFLGGLVTYNLGYDDIVLVGNDNEFEDCAIIILPSSAIPYNIDLKKAPISVTVETDKFFEFQTIGYGKITQNNQTRTLYECQLLNDRDFIDHLQLIVNDPVAVQYNADDLIEGYSGGPIFKTIGQQLYVLGVFVGYEDVTRRINAINISFVNILLERNAFSLIPIVPVEMNIDILNDLKKVENNGKRVLDRIRSNIGKAHISRTKLVEELKQIILKHKLIVIHGKPGIGKSAATKEVLLSIPGYSLITLQGEQLDKNSIVEVFKSPEIGIGTELNEVLSSPGMAKEKIIFVDSIEKLLETTHAETIIDFFGLVTERDDLRLVLTCRSYAVEQFKIRFLQQFNDFCDFEVPVLCDQELMEISKSYPFLEPLLKNESLKKILEIPFNIDKATLIEKGMQNTTLNNEQDFKAIMWDHVIEGKENEPDIIRQKLRGKIFSEIAYKRAELMVSYVEYSTEYLDIVHALQKDQLIEENIHLGLRYSPSHDIYEDWALTKKIETDYQNYLIGNTIIGFFYEIGDAPAIRRAFRIWISEKLQLIDFNIQDLILSCLSAQSIKTYWKDEILIAIMQSPYSKVFLDKNKAFLFDNDFYLFKRCALLLHVACQSPNLDYLPHLPPEEKNSIYTSQLLKPYGQGWVNMINFIWDHISDLNTEFRVIMKIIFQWETILEMSKAGREAKSAALILNHYLEFHIAHINADSNQLISNDNLKIGIRIFLRLASLIPEEVRRMLVESQREEESDNYRIKDFWETFNNIVLDWNYSYAICRLFPDLVLAIAEKEWFYYPPSEEEIRKQEADFPFSVSRRPDTEEQFGITHDRNYRYSPASAYQTPIWHLLAGDTVKTMDFIIKLFNHSVEAFFKSDFMQSRFFGDDEKRYTMNVITLENEVIEVNGSEILWCMYRGLHNITAPNLLKSVLMALERWILDIAAQIVKDKNNQISEQIQTFEFIFNYLLTKTKSVSILAVLVSVATAYPELCKRIIQPLLKVRQFYKWDLVRRLREGSDRYMGFDDSKLIRNERKTSDQMEHRSSHMETLVISLSLTTEKKNIYNILDEFYSQSRLDDKWRLALNRMDFRKAKVVEKTELSVTLMPEIDEDLLPVIAEVQNNQNILQPIQIAANWACKRFVGETFENDGYAEWKKHYEVVSNAPEGNDNIQLFNQPGTLAAVAVKYFFDELTTMERDWCLNHIFYITQAEIGRSQNHYALVNDKNYSALDPDYIFKVLVDLVEKCKGDQLVEAKELLFLSLIFIRNDQDREYLMNSVRTRLWNIDQKFVLNCVAGLVEYAKIADLKTRVSYFQPGLRAPRVVWKKSKLARKYIDLKNKIIRMILSIKILEKRRIKRDEAIRQGWIDSYEKTFYHIIENVVYGQIDINYDIDTKIKISSYHLIEILGIIPFDHNNQDVHNYYDFITRHVLSQIKKKELTRQEEIHFTLQQKFTSYYSKYLLAQSNENSLIKFKNLTNLLLEKDDKGIAYSFIDKRWEVVENVLKDMLHYVYRVGLIPPPFWIIWKYILEQFSSKTKRFNQLLLLNPGHLSHGSLLDLDGKREFLKEIIQKLRDIKGTIWLLAGTGYDELMPEGIEWYVDLIKEEGINDKNSIFLSEKLIIKIYHDKIMRQKVKGHPRLRSSFILLLDELIDKNSAAAFLIREDFISLNN